MESSMWKHKVELAKSIIARSCKRPNPKSRLTLLKKKCSSVISHSADEIGYTVDLDDLLFTPQRNFLIKNNGQKVRVGDRKGKTVVLFIVPIYESSEYKNHTLDVIQAYDELLPLGGTEFVFVPVHLDYLTKAYHARPPRYLAFASQEDCFNHFFSIRPWPAVPFSDIDACGDRIVRTFSLDSDGMHRYAIPYWVIIDPKSTVVATRQFLNSDLFKLFGRAELHPLSLERMAELWDEHYINGNHGETQKCLMRKWDQLLASPTRNFLLSSSGEHVPISSLKGKIIGLYFCENVSHPPRMEMIKKVYGEAKLRGYDFEIVQITFHYYFFNATYNGRAADMSVHQCRENISWLTLPFKDPSCRKLQRIFECEIDECNDVWEGDCLVIVDARQADEVLFEFSGAEIFKQYGIEGYPFTRQSLVETEYRIQKKELKLQFIFPPGFCQLIRLAAGGGFDLTDGAFLKGKRVVVLFGTQRECESSTFVSMLESKYREQADENNKFEVVYVSDDYRGSDFTECIKGMPWLVHPYDEYFQRRRVQNIFKTCEGIAAVAFDRDGELIAKIWPLDSTWGEEEHHKNASFPFVSQDLKEQIQMEVESMCRLRRYYDSDDEE